MIVIFWIIATTLFVSVLSLVGILTLLLRKNLLPKIIFLLVSLAAGVLMGGAFLHLIPEAMNTIKAESLYLSVLTGFVAFFLLEKLLMWRHCHKSHCSVHTFSYMSLFGDGFHNFIDGVLIAASFITDINLGIATTVAVAMHEIPQEIGDFGVLLHGGFKVTKALMLNFLFSLTAVAGGLIVYFFPSGLGVRLDLVLPFTAGGFLYIAASDLIPQLREEMDKFKFVVNLLVFVAGILLMYALKLV